MGYKLKYRASEINTLLDVVKNDVMDKDLVGKGQLVQSDASEWDDTKLSYIKNRTHYEDVRIFTAPFEFAVPHGVVGGVTIIYEDQETSVDVGNMVRLPSATGGTISIIYGETGIISVTESEPSITEDSPITVKYCKPLDEKFLPSSVATKDDIIKTYKTDFTVSDLFDLANGNIDSIAISKEFYEAVLRGDVIVIGTGDSQGGVMTSTEYSVMEDYTRIRLLLLFSGRYIEVTCTVDNVNMEGSVDFIDYINLQDALVDGENFSTINGQSLLCGGDIVINEPYLAPFSVQDLDSVIDRGRLRFPKDEFRVAVASGRPLVVPIHRGDNSGITASYYITGAETGEEIVIDIIHGSKVYHLVLEDVLQQSFIIITPDSVSCKDPSNVYVVPYTLSEIQYAANNRTTLQVDADFVDAVYNKKLILIPNGKTVADGQYISVFYTFGSVPSSNVSITLRIFNGTKTFDIRFSSESVAPTASNVAIEETPLMTEKSFSNIYGGDTTTVARPSYEFTVNSIDGATFINDGKTTAMTPNTVYNFVNNGVNRTIAVYDDHRVVITSENNSTVPLSPAVTYTSNNRIKPSALPSSLVTKPELREAIQNNQADWLETDQESTGFIKNRTHYYRIHGRLKPSLRFVLAAPIVINDLQIQSLGDYKLLLNDKFYEFDESVSAGDTVTFGAGEKQQATFTVLSKLTSGNTISCEYRLDAVGGVAPDSNGFFLDIVTKGKTLDPIYLPELRGDWEETDANSLTFINNKTHSAPVYYPFRVGERISLIEDKVNHTIDNYRVRYEGKLYALPTEIGGEVYIPSAADWKFKVAYELYNENDTKSIYNINSYVNPDITLENASVEIITDIPELGGKKLDEFYISENIARVGTTEDNSSKNSIFGAKRYSDEQRTMLINEYMNVKPTVRMFHSTDPNKSSIYAYHPYLNEFGDGELVVMRYGKTKMAKWVLDGDERFRKHVTKTGWRECLGAPINLNDYVDEEWKDARFTEPAKLYVGQNDYMAVLEEICARATYDRTGLVLDSGEVYESLVSMAQLMARYDMNAISTLQERFYASWERYYHGVAEAPPDYSIFGGKRNRVTLGVALRVLNPEFQRLIDEGVLDADSHGQRRWYCDVNNDITIPKYLYSDVCEMYLSKGSMAEMINLDLPRAPRLSLKG